MIYHITSKEQWEHALQTGFYIADSLPLEGFIHTSKHEQVEGVLQRYYRGKENLVMLEIDESKVIPEIKYELAPSINEIFPHIFGPLNIEAVTKISDVGNPITTG